MKKLNTVLFLIVLFGFTGASYAGIVNGGNGGTNGGVCCENGGTNEGGNGIPSVPEPSTLLLISAGVLGLVVARKFKK